MDKLIFIDIDLNCLNKDHESNIEFYCKTCNDIPICKECFPYHDAHSIQPYSDDKKDILINNFKSSISEYESEIDFLKQELKQLEEHLNETKCKSNDKIKLIQNQFQKIHQILQREENNLKNQIITIQDENQVQFDIKQSLIKTKIQTLESAVNKFKNNNKQMDHLSQEQLIKLSKQHIDINKFNYNICELNKNLPPFFFIIQPYQNVYFNIHANTETEAKLNSSANEISKLMENDDFGHPNIESIFKDFVSNLFSISCIEKINNYYVVLDDKLPQSMYNEFNNFAISTDFGTPPETIPNCNELLCLDVNALRKNINLYNTVNTLNYINIKDPILPGSIPRVKKLSLYNHSHQIVKHVIPGSVESLHLLNIQHPLDVGSIPSSVKDLHIKDGFKHKLSTGIIPDSVEYLSIYNVQEPLEIGSIPSSVKCLNLHNGFKHRLCKGIIPESVTELTLHNIELPLESSSIPTSVISLYFEDGFKHSLSKCIMSSKIQWLLSSNESDASLTPTPISSKNLYIDDKLKLQLEKYVIPNGVIELYINSSLIKLDEISIPPSVKDIFLFNKNITINLDIINNNLSTIKNLYLTKELYEQFKNNTKVNSVEILQL